MIRKWQRQRRNRKVLEGVAQTLLSKYTHSGTDRTQVLEFARKLGGIDFVVAERLPDFIESASDNHAAARNVIRLVHSQEHAAGSLRILMAHFEYLLEVQLRPSGFFADWIKRILVNEHRLHEWRLPLEREREIIALIVALHQAGTRVGGWLVPFLLNNPDKSERAMEMLRQRDVPTLQDMEALLDDDTPMVMQDGAL
jgi:hypothetical protein